MNQAQRIEKFKSSLRSISGNVQQNEPTTAQVEQEQCKRDKERRTPFSVDHVGERRGTNSKSDEPPERTREKILSKFRASAGDVDLQNASAKKDQTKKRTRSHGGSPDAESQHKVRNNMHMQINERRF